MACGRQTIWGSGDIAKQKQPAALGIRIPVEILQDRDVSALEAIVRYLKEQEGWTYSQIARTLNRDDRTIWTTYNRTLKKVTRMDRDQGGERL